MKIAQVESAGCVPEVFNVGYSIMKTLFISMLSSNISCLSARNVEYYGGLMLNLRLIEITFEFFMFDFLVFTFNSKHNSLENV